MKMFRVDFFPMNAEVEAEDKLKAEEEAIALLIDGELHYEVKSVEEIPPELQARQKAEYDIKKRRGESKGGG